MSTSSFSEAIRNYNKRSLQKLIWAISASQGEFKLLVVRCNYEKLQQLMLQDLQAEKTGLQLFELEPSSRALYTLLRRRLSKTVPDSVCVLGLEKVSDLSHLLTSLNQIREELRQNLHFPLILWVTDKGLLHLKEKAPDLESWATKIRFEFPPDIIRHSLQEGANKLFSTALSSDFDRVGTILNAVEYMGELKRFEVDMALQDFKDNNNSLEPILEANLEFAQGLIALDDTDSGSSEDHQTALNHFNRSLRFWQQQAMPPDSLQAISEGGTKQQSLDCPLLRAGLLYFYIGRCRYCLGDKLDSVDETRQARDALKQAIAIFEQTNRTELIIYCLPQLGQIIRRIAVDDIEGPRTDAHWQDLESLAHQGIQLHQTHPHAWGVVQFHSFLIDVASYQKNYLEAKQSAKDALRTLKQVGKDKQWFKSLLLLLLAEAEQRLGHAKLAIEALELAKSLGVQNHPKIYIRILKKLHTIYFAQGEAIPDDANYFLKAFRVKMDRLSIEQQYGLRAFVGAGRLQPEQNSWNGVKGTSKLKELGQVATEMQVSRQREIDDLMQRIREPNYKLIILHGLSGVGKSSLIEAALMPTLTTQSSGIQENLPILVRAYDNWAKHLAHDLIRVLKLQNIQIIPELENEIKQDITQNSKTKNEHIPSDSLISAIHEQLRQLDLSNDEYHLQTILIFDQFEEIFVVSNDTEEQRQLRQQFFSFLADCLELLYLKVILSLREDFLHFLLQGSRLSMPARAGQDDRVLSRNILSDILNEKKLYFIGNFSKSDSVTIIKRLTDRTGNQLPDNLVEALVEDLSAEIGEVRPIELQVVGSILQEKQITTLQEYRQLGTHPKEVLVEDFLDQVIVDCGPQNEDTAKMVLYLLTGDKEIRPRKTLHELEQDSNLKSFNTEQLRLILEILVESRLVLLLPEVSEERYQLVHDYLATLIRRKIDPSRIENKRQQKEIASLKQAGKKKTQFIRASTIFSLLAVVLAGIAIKEGRQAIISNVQAAVSEAEFLAVSGDQIKALVKSYEVTHAVERNVLFRWILPAKTRLQAAGQILTSFQHLQEVDSFSAHPTAIKEIAFGDPELVATASADKTIRLWGAETTPIPGHDGRVNSISFHPTCAMLASASDDGQIKLWDLEGIPIETNALSEESSGPRGVERVRISPDGKWMVTGDGDGRVKFWQLTCRDIPSEDNISTRNELPGDALLASKNVELELKLVDDKKLTTAQGQADRIRDIQFHPTAPLVAVSSFDNTINLWNVTGGEPFQTLRGCNISKTATVDNTSNSTCKPGEFSALSFNAEGNILASGGTTNRVYLWNQDPATKKYIPSLHPLETDRRVVDLSFSKQQGFNTLAVAVDTDGVILWDTNKDLAPTNASFQRQQIINVRNISTVEFSPDGRLLAGLNTGVLKTWEINRPQTDKAYTIPDLAVQSFSLNIDGTRLATVTTPTPDQKSRLSLWNLEDISDPAQIIDVPVPGTTKDVEIHPNRSVVAFVATETPATNTFRDRGVRVFCRGEDGLIQPCIEREFDTVADIRFSPTGEYLAIAEGLTKSQCQPDSLSTQTIGKLEVGRLHLLSIQSGTREIESTSTSTSIFTPCILGEESEGEQDALTRINFSPNSRYLAVGLGSNVVLYQLEQGKLNEMESIRQGHRAQVNDVTFSQRSDFLASVSDDKTIRIRPLEQGFWRRLRFYVGGFWQIQRPQTELSGRETSTPYQGHEGLIKRVLFVRSNETLFSMDTKGELWLWDLNDNSNPAVKSSIPSFYLDTPNDPLIAVNSIDYNENQNMLLFIGKGNQLYFWKVSWKDLQGKICDWLQRPGSIDPASTGIDLNCENTL
ncbi:wd-40 repeat-containing protein [Leptolyngbya sp. Heron Island J]|uniref:NACHT and WD repeat domain-containing protein n=1 Tax=Leptolyngbya sp. Heron Island J TaxID=1385935 RepID=UPI0003B96F76|nr:AAA family ATPase [Leptolyngbya sp. Heron Island J]ESA32159.1 wd-40 repeat-containing protein [Leptolyngbya sp. Heron Island J]